MRLCWQRVQWRGHKGPDGGHAQLIQVVGKEAHVAGAALAIVAHLCTVPAARRVSCQWRSAALQAEHCLHPVFGCQSQHQEQEQAKPVLSRGGEPVLRQLGLPGWMQPVLEHVVSIRAPITSRALAVLQIHSTSTFRCFNASAAGKAGPQGCCQHLLHVRTSHA